MWQRIEEMVSNATKFEHFAKVKTTSKSGNQNEKKQKIFTRSLEYEFIFSMPLALMTILMIIC